MFKNFAQKGKASFVLGGQWGSEGKGAAAAAIAAKLAERGVGFDIIVTNAGAQAGHTSTHKGVNRIVFHLPTASLIQDAALIGGCRNPPLVYLDAGSIIDPDGLKKELDENMDATAMQNFFIHPNAAVITQECRDAENKYDSAQTKIASTRKGVGEALSRKVLRSGSIAKDHPYLSQFVRRIDLNDRLRKYNSILVEVPQGLGLSVDSDFYPHTTSRNCTIGQAMSDAAIHPHFYGQTMLVLRTFPIRVGNIPGMDPTTGQITGLLGHSGGHYPDQSETTWEELGQKAEITTVTKRVRRVFSFSRVQMHEAMAATRPNFVYLTFCDYLKSHHTPRMLANHIMASARMLDMPYPTILYQYGPTTDDVFTEPK